MITVSTRIYGKESSPVWGAFARSAAQYAAVAILFLSALLGTGTEIQAALVQGDQVVNIVSVSSATTPVTTAMATVTAVIRTPSKIEYLQYAPNLPGIPATQVVPGSYRSGANPAAPFLPLPAPIRAGSSTPIDLSHPIPLAPATQLHQGDPLFIRLTDKDQNLDRTRVETVFVTVTNPANGDVEVLLLTETGPDTGVFVAYLPTTHSATTAYGGSMSVSEGNVLTTRYVDKYDGTDSSATAIMVDPYGIFVDTLTGLPVNGATITMINVATGLPATIWGDDGVSSYPATLVSGGSASDSGGQNYSFPPGGYRYPFVNAGTYRFDITPPPGYSAPSTVTTAVIQTLPGAPYAIVNGSRKEVFVINPGPALRIDVPLDPAPAALWVQKSSGRDTVGIGEFVPYKLSVTNNSMAAAAGAVKLTDTLPPGFRLRKGSVLLNSLPAADPIVSGDGRTLLFSLGTVGPAAVVTLDYVTEVTAGARIGTATNSAVASSLGVQSNIAQASVKVRDDLLRTRSILMGRVSTGVCSEESGDGPDGVPGIRIYLEDGTFVVSDKRGMFHFEGVRPGLHIVQLDLDSLPDGYEAFPCTENSRFAGRAFSQFVETQGGTLWRTDFHIRAKAQTPVETAAVPKQAAPVPAPLKGEAIIELANAIEGKNIAYRVNMRGKALPQQSTELKVILPEGVTYESGSSKMDGADIADPKLQDKSVLVYPLGALPDGWSHEFTFRGIPSRELPASRLTTVAYLMVESVKGAKVLTPPAETILQLDKEVEVQRMPDIVLRPHFPSFGDELDDEDRQQLDELARLLIGLRTEKIHVTGHTDNVRIAPRSRNIHADNIALSKARAKSVGRYLMDKLHFPPEKLSLDGKGESEPVASNSNEAGRAGNRRVEVKITSNRIISRQQMTVLKALSGEQRTETAEETQDDSSSAEASQPKSAAPESGAIPEKPLSSASAGVTDVPETAAATATPPASEAKVPQVVTGKAAQPESAAAVAVDDPVGFIGRKEGDLLVNRINTVQFKLDSGLTARLLVDGVEVPAKQLGFQRRDPASGKTQYGYLGVDFGEAGEHTLTMQGLDPFGNARYNKSIKLTRTGDIASIRLISAEGNVADGKSPVRIRLELFDNAGNPIRAAAELELRDGALKPAVQHNQTLEEKATSRRLEMDRDGWVAFQPVTVSGPYRVVIAYNTVTLDVDLYVKPKLRDWILVGLAEGTLGYNTVSGNMENLKAGEVAENFYKDGRAAFFAKGQIKGEWLLTMSYDSAKAKGESGNALFQQIDPDSFYTLYGDSTQQQYDAASSKKLYVKVERGQFYAMFGDFDAGLSVTELSRYSRRMTGVKSEYQDKHIEAAGFASESTQVYQRDELPGDGTSGLYRIKRRPLVANSEKISIVTRDRFRSEVIISSVTMSRFVDYAIDYEAGTIFFKQPVMSKDENFNPITIVVEYESLANVGSDYTYGGRVGLKLFDKKLKIGATHVHEGLGDRKNDLFGVDTTIMLAETTKLRGEAAGTESNSAGVRMHGYSYLAELTHTSKKFDGKAYIREQQGAFGLGQQMGSESATRKFGLEGNYRLNESFSSSASLYRQTNMSVSTERDVAEGKLSYATKKYSTFIGLLHAQDRLTGGNSMNSGQISAGGKLFTLQDKLTLSINHSQSVWGNSNIDFPTRTTLGAEYKVNEKVSLLGAQEFTWGKTAQTNATRLGVRSTPWKGGTLTSTVERQLNENGSRIFGNMGLRQSWQLTDEWKVDAGLDRSQTIHKKSSYTLNPAVAPASSASEDFTAVSTGATYLVKGLTWDSRFEYRSSASEEKWGVISGVVKEQSDNLAWSARGQYFNSSATSGMESHRANLRLGLVYRPSQSRWIHLNRLDVIHENQNGGGQPGMTSWRLVNNYSVNYKPRKHLQVSLKYGAKFVMDTISGRRYQAYTDHTGFELRYDITKKWDVGLRGSLLHTWNSGQLAYSGGASTGYNLVDNAWVSLGYNVWGFTDKDFSAADYTAQGPYVRFRMKFDQNSIKDGIKALNQ